MSLAPNHTNPYWPSDPLLHKGWRRKTLQHNESRCELELWPEWKQLPDLAPPVEEAITALKDDLLALHGYLLWSPHVCDLSGEQLELAARDALFDRVRASSSAPTIQHPVITAKPLPEHQVSSLFEFVARQKNHVSSIDNLLAQTKPSTSVREITSAAPVENVPAAVAPPTQQTNLDRLSALKEKCQVEKLKVAAVEGESVDSAEEIVLPDDQIDVLGSQSVASVGIALVAMDSPKPLLAEGSTSVFDSSPLGGPLKPAEANAYAKLLAFVRANGRKPSRRELMDLACCGTATATAVLTAVYSPKGLASLLCGNDPTGYLYIIDSVFRELYREKENDGVAKGNKRRNSDNQIDTSCIGTLFTDGNTQAALHNAAVELFRRYPHKIHLLSGTVSANSDQSYLTVALNSHYAQQRVLELLGQRLGITNIEHSLAWEISPGKRLLHWHAFCHIPNLNITIADLRHIWLTVLDEIEGHSGISPFINVHNNVFSHIDRSEVNVHLHDRPFDPRPQADFPFFYHAKTHSKTPRKLVLLGGAELSPVSWGSFYLEPPLADLHLASN